MMKNTKLQKKKSPLGLFLDILFKVLIAIAIIIFLIIAITKVDFSTGTMDFNSKDKKEVASIPSSLKWFDDFKGVENIPSNKQKEQKEKESRGSSTGFNYQGFGK